MGQWLGMSYYTELKLTKSASHEDVTAGFRRFGLQWHPDRNPDNPVEAKKEFDKKCETYDVLSNPLYRAIYDQYGEKGLKDGVADGRGGTVKGTGKYHFGLNGDSNAIFMRVFGTDNPFAELFQVSKEFFDPSYVPPKTTAMEVPLQCSLEELAVGGIKVATIDLPGYGMKDVSIEVKKGWREGARLTMSAKDILKGEACPKCLVGAEFVFVVREKAHAVFKRDGDDLVHHATIPLVRALTGCTLTLATLDGREAIVGVNDVISPGFEKVLCGEGMPSYEEPDKRGDLIVKYQIEFPRALDDKQRHLIKSSLFLSPKLSGEQEGALKEMRKVFPFD